MNHTVLSVHFTGGEGVVGSNPAAPTILNTMNTNGLSHPLSLEAGGIFCFVQTLCKKPLEYWQLSLRLAEPGAGLPVFMSRRKFADL